MAIAVLMALVLAASTGGAVWLSHARAPGSVADLEQQRFGWVEVAHPDDWIGEGIEDPRLIAEPGLAPLATYIDPGPMQHVLSVYQYTSLTPVGPEAALAVITEQLGFVIGQPQWFRGSPVFEGTAEARGSEGMVGLSDELLVVSRGGAVLHQAMAMLTLDGTRHIVLTMTGPVQQAQRTRELLRTIVATVRDVRYEPAELPFTFAGRQIEQMPPELMVYQSSDPGGGNASGGGGESGGDSGGGGELLIVPRQTAAFVAVRATPVNLDEQVATLRELLPGSQQASNPRLIPDRLEELLRDPRLDFRGRMDMALVWRYWLVHGRPPAIGAIADASFDSKPVRALAISGRASPTYRLAWVLGLDDDTAVLLEATASDEAAWPARQTAQRAAQMLVQD